MIKKLKKKFVILAAAMMLALVTLIVAGMNIVNYSAVVSEADGTLEVLSGMRRPEEGKEHNPPDKPDDDKHFSPDPRPENPGEAPDDEHFRDFMDRMEKHDLRDRMGGRMNIEVAYESRFFSVALDGDGKILSSDLSMTASVSEDEVASFVSAAQSKKADKGFVKNFRFLKTDGGILFLDCGRKLETYNRFLLISSVAGLCGCILAFVIFILISGRIVKPISESYEKQKMFITDAGHEIKTPLTIIAANVELLKSGAGDDECLDDIASQTERLKTLTNDLVSLSRLEETKPGPSALVEFPASETVEESALPFVKAAEFAGKTLRLSVTPLIALKGDKALLERLVSILLDNAVKYSSEGGTINLSFETKGKSAVLCVSNSVERTLSPDELGCLFDRFYRTDRSRSSATGGHGIGLSIAKASVEAFGGEITAQMSDGETFRITARFPQ